MAAPVASYVQLPSDTANTGKKNRTQTKVVGSDTVHEHFFVPDHGYTRAGRYIYQSALTTISASSQTATGSGMLWLTFAAASSGYACQIKSISMDYGIANSSVVAAANTPRILFTKYSYTGTQSTGSEVTTTQVLKCGASTSQALHLCTTSSGATITKIGELASFAVPALFTTVGEYGGHVELYRAGESYHRNSAMEFTTAQGLVIWQADAAATSDARGVSFRIEWEEIDTN